MHSMPTEIEGKELLDPDWGALVDLGIAGTVEYNKAIAIYGKLPNKKQPSTVCLGLAGLPYTQDSQVHLHPEIEEARGVEVRREILEYVEFHHEAECAREVVQSQLKSIVTGIN